MNHEYVHDVSPGDREDNQHRSPEDAEERREQPRRGSGRVVDEIETEVVHGGNHTRQGVHRVQPENGRIVGGGGFRFTNPTATKTCNCGQSFQI